MHERAMAVSEPKCRPQALDETDRLPMALTVDIWRRVDTGNLHWMALERLFQDLAGERAACTNEKGLPRSVVAACTTACPACVLSGQPAVSLGDGCDSA